MEGNLRIGCTHDGLGHITARVILRGDIFGSDWRAEDSIFLEAGQLDRIAAEAGVYFG
jgi:hypothetical protein